MLWLRSGPCSQTIAQTQSPWGTWVFGEQHIPLTRHSEGACNFVVSASVKLQILSMSLFLNKVLFNGTYMNKYITSMLINLHIKRD